MDAIAISLSGPFPQAVAAGLRRVGSALQSNGTKRAVLLVPHLSSFDSTVIAEVFGAEIAAELKKNRVVGLGDGISLTLHSPKTLSYGVQVDELLAAYVDTKALTESLSKLAGIKTVVFVPWMDSERDSFVAKFKAEVEHVPDPRDKEEDS